MVDVFKLIMSVFVVSLHTMPGDTYEGTLLFGIWRASANMAVPFFFLATGFFLYRKLSLSPMNEKSVLKQHVIKYIKLYLIWSLIYLPLAIIYYYKNDFTCLSAAMNYVKELFWSGQHYNSWILWYLLSAIYALVAICVITAIVKNNTLSAVLLFAISAIAYFAFCLLLGKTAAPSTIRLLNGGIYIPLGMLICRYFCDKDGGVRKNVNKSLVVLPCCLLLVIGIAAGSMCYTTPIYLDAVTLFSACALFIAVMMMNDKAGFPTLALRHISSTVYFVHLYVWTGYYSVVYGEKTFGIDCFAAVSILSILCGLILETIKRLRQHRLTENNI